MLKREEVKLGFRRDSLALGEIKIRALAVLKMEPRNVELGAIFLQFFCKSHKTSNSQRD